MTDVLNATGPLARKLAEHRDEVLALIAAQGGSNVRVFGSIATGKERPDSDIDLLFTMGRPMGYLALGRLSRAIERALAAPVDLVPDEGLHPAYGARILAEAVAL